MSLRRHIPNAITSGNLLCGALGVIFALGGHIDTAFLLMLAGGVCDFCDGFAARALGVSSPIGKELDSLADVVSFGLLPSVMLYAVNCGNAAGCTSFCPVCKVLGYLPLAIAVFSGLRLAKFNVDPRQSSSFIGLPTPACALLCGSLAYNSVAAPGSPLANLCASTYFTAILSIVLAILLVCEIPMFSMKFHKGEGQGKTFWLRICFALCALLSAGAVIALKWNWSCIVALSFTSYIIINVAGATVKEK